jgi:nucleoside-diphosphate-sugar epimerase
LNQRDSPKRVLVTSAHTDLAQAIADALAVNYEVHLTAPGEVATRHSFSKIELGDDSPVDTLVRGMDTIVHLAQPPDDARDEDHIDDCTRGTYNLLRSAASEGVRHVFYLSSLELLIGYDEEFEVTEDWRPLPSDDAQVLSHCLGEFTCREFAREGRVGVVVLRLGKIVRADQLAGAPFNPLWIDQRDAVQAVSKAMKARLSGTGPLTRAWSVFHIHSGSPQARFTSERAKREFGYEPQFL